MKAVREERGSADDQGVSSSLRGVLNREFRGSVVLSAFIVPALSAEVLKILGGVAREWLGEAAASPGKGWIDHTIREASLGGTVPIAHWSPKSALLPSCRTISPASTEAEQNQPPFL